MTTKRTLESELERRASESDSDAKDFWHRYKSMKSYLSDQYYPWIQANCPFFTDHGEQHIRSVLDTASGFLSKSLNSPDTEKQITSLDIFLILCGVLWHDVGNVLGRSGHAERVSEMITKIKTLGFPNIQIQRLVEEISKAHGGSSGLEIPKIEDPCATKFGNYEIRPRALAAIVRFADEVSENHTRVSAALLPDVPEENKIYWEYASCIRASVPDPSRNRIVINIEIQIEALTRPLPCKDKFACTNYPARVKSGKMHLIDYVLSRLEKMNNERIYCAPYFNQYFSIREIEVRLTILKGTERFPKYDGTTICLTDSGIEGDSYPCVKIVDDFFLKYPKWKARAIQREFSQ